jgi:hypothetical protein
VAKKTNRRGEGDRMTLTFEDMIRAETDMYVCRIWWKRIDNSPSDKEMLKCTSRDTMRQFSDIDAMVRSIAACEEVSAVEIIDRRTGDGVCVYKDWP